ncbi:MAG: hypothetical protein MUE68_05320 [Bacteroidetes bacterium]|nr:hypothetical protein [Bacteroidota bacterium]
MHCTHEIRSAEEACGWCGRWQNGHMPMCETHPTAPSVGLCVVCARPVCGTCAQRADGRLFCDDPAHQAFAADHTLVGSFDSEFEADWVAVVLRRAGIPSYAYSFRDHVSSWWFPLPSAVRLFIPASRAAEARAVLADVDDLPTSL